MTPQRRQQALQHYLDHKLRGDREALILKSGLSKARISQLLNYGFGERAARRLEHSLRLAEGWLDEDHSRETGREQREGGDAAPPKVEVQTPEEVAMDLQRQAAELVRAWMSLNETDRNRFKRELEVYAMHQNREPVSDYSPNLVDYAKASARAKAKMGAP